MTRDLTTHEGMIQMASTVKSRLTKIRDGYVRRHTLRRELSAYMSAGQLSDLQAALARHDAENSQETMEVRTILAETQRNLMSVGRY
jgi:ribosomal protein L9